MELGEVYARASAAQMIETMVQHQLDVDEAETLVTLGLMAVAGLIDQQEWDRRMELLLEAVARRKHPSGKQR